MSVVIKGSIIEKSRSSLKESNLDFSIGEKFTLGTSTCLLLVSIIGTKGKIVSLMVDKVVVRYVEKQVKGDEK